MDGIIVKILGDFGPFSRMGKSIGYQLEIGSARYLIDCGSPLFQQIGGHGLSTFDGLFITHCHDDHKRWFTDLALFNRYARDVARRVKLITSEDVYCDLLRASKPSLETSLSADSKKVIDIPFEEYVDYLTIGPKAKYRIVSGIKDGYHVADSSGAALPPDKAKVVIHPRSGSARMLFVDPASGEWVEPEIFYTFSSEVFYESSNAFSGEGFTIEAIKAPVWHGVNGIGLRVSTERETLVFSSDTAHDKDLWHQLYTEKRIRNRKLSVPEFEAASVIYGDINDYTERTWSKERYLEAMAAFEDAVVIHDVSAGGSVVHTDYEKLGSTTLDRGRTLLTHSPDRLTSEWVLCKAGKTYQLLGDRVYEITGSGRYPLDADIYHKESGRYFAGYKDENGSHAVAEHNGLLSLVPAEEAGKGDTLYRVVLYEDIAGGYFPRLQDEAAVYIERPDGKVELLRFSENGSSGMLVEDMRPTLCSSE